MMRISKILTEQGYLFVFAKGWLPEGRVENCNDERFSCSIPHPFLLVGFLDSFNTLLYALVGFGKVRTPIRRTGNE